MEKTQMYNDNGMVGLLKLLAVLGFIILGVNWLTDGIGRDYTVLVIFALIGVILFAGGALFAHVNQRQTLDAITKFNANDSQIDRYRQATFKELARGESAQVRADAQLRVLDARRIDQLAQERARLLVDTQQQQQAQQRNAWDASEQDFAGWGGQALYDVMEE